MKLSLLKICGICVICGLLLPGCQTTAFSPATNAKIVTTDGALVQSAKDFGVAFIQNAATSELDAAVKGDFKMSSGDALRTLEGAAVSAGLQGIYPLVKNLVGTWLPQKPHWADYSNEVASLVNAYVKAHPTDPHALNTALESVAQGLQTPAP